MFMLAACAKEVPDSKVLATVNGSDITEYELEQTILRTLKIDNTAQVNGELRNNVLKTMVLSRVIQQTAEEKLDQEKKHSIEAQVQSYREDLYLKAYLQEFSPPRPATPEMIQKFYEQNLERFGGGQTIYYEMIAGVTSNSSADDGRLMRTLERAGQSTEWRKYSAQLLQQGLPVRFSQGEASDAILHSRLRDVMQHMEVGDVSPVVLVDGNPYVVRVKDIIEKTPEPLEHVSAEIRRLLVPVQLKNALEDVSDALIKQSDIQYKKTEL